MAIQRWLKVHRTVYPAFIFLSVCDNDRMTHNSDSSLVVFIAFGVVGVALLAVVVFLVMDHVVPAVSGLLGGVSPMSLLDGWLSRLRPHRRQDEQEGDDLDDTTAALLSVLPGASVVVDESDEVVRASPAAYALGVVVDDEVADNRVLERIHDIRRSGGKRQFTLQTTTPWQYEHAFDDPEGNGGGHRTTRPNWLNVTVGRIGERFVVVLLEDRSESIRFAQVRDSFITNVSQQLLKPTEALSQLADSLEQGEPDCEQVRRDARQVRSACGHLNRMVSDLLLLIKAQEPITPSAANVITVTDQVRQAVQAAQPDADRLGVRVDVTGDDSLQVHGDGEQIRTAVGKLVDNAIGYSPRGSTVTVTVGASRDGELAVIRVIDRGVGIARDEQSRVFERFYRGANQNERTQDGIGLGLAIVKHVALTHHGSASVWSRHGQGSTFTLSLPLAR